MELVVISIFSGAVIPMAIFMMKQISDLKKEIARLCERMTKEETKSQIYHNDNK